MNNKKIKKVYIGMSADIIHPGHLNIINQGAKLGKVVVGVLTDKAIASYKRLPYLNFKQRQLIIKNIKDVYKVIPQDTLDYTKNLLKEKPDFVVHGDDWKNGVQKAVRSSVVELIKDWGGKVVDVPYTKGISSTILNEKIKEIGITPEIRMQRLRRLLNAKPILRVLEAHSGLSGLIIEKTKLTIDGCNAEFDGMWSSSLTDSTMKGKPDIEAIDITSRLQTINDILETTTKPIIFDGDTGGKIEHFVFTVRTLERLGISAVIIEDKIGLKKNSLLGLEVSQKQDSISSFSRKISAGKKSQITNDFMIIARIESLILNKTIDDAIARSKAYINAGADGIMIHSKEKNGADITSFCKKLRSINKTIPLVVVPTTYNHITEDEFKKMGVNIVIYANHLLRSAYPSMVNVAKSILKNKRSLEVDKDCLTIKEILGLIPGTK